MFNLDEEIAEWRRQMFAGIKTPARLDELESHLRDDVEQQMRSGLKEQQAFETAVRRIGQADALKAEFKNAGCSIETRLVQLTGIACGVIAGLFSLWILGTLLTVHEVSQTARMLGLAAVAATFLGWRYGHRFLPVIRDQRARTVIGAVCCIAGAVWMASFIRFILPHFIELPAGSEIAVGQLLVSFLWAWTMMAIPGAVAYGLEEAARRRTATADS